MARRSPGSVYKIVIFLLILMLAAVLYAYNRDKIDEFLAGFLGKADKAPQSTEAPKSTQVIYPKGFPLDGIKEKIVDTNHNGKNEVLLTSVTKGVPHAVLVDASDRSKILSNIFNFSTKGYPEAEFTSEEAPEIYQLADLDGDGKDEIILDLKSYGAYTSLYGVITLKNGIFSWAMLKDETGQEHPAIFEDGASVRNANIFKVLTTEKPPALVQIYGGSQDETHWTWNADAYQWSGSIYNRNPSLSNKVVSEQPKQIVNGKPVF